MSNSNSHLLYIQTEHVVELKILFETLKDVLHDTPVTFIKDGQKSDGKGEAETGGIKIMTLDDRKTLLIYVKLDAKGFMKFNIKPKIYNAGIDLTNLHKYLKTIKEGIMTIHIDDDNEQFIVFEVYNDDQKSSNEYKLKLLDLNHTKYSLPASQYTMMVVMDCTECHRLFREMSQISDFVEIICTNKMIQFTCQGDSASNVRTFENCNDVDSRKGVKIINTNNNPNEIIRAIYELKYLVMFNKCVNLCEEIKLYLRNEYPLFIEYSIATLGKMLVGITHVDDKNIHDDDTAFYQNSSINIKQ